MRTLVQSYGGIPESDDLLVAINRFLDATLSMAEWPQLSDSEYVARILAYANGSRENDAEELLDLSFELLFGTTVPPEERGGGSDATAGILCDAQDLLISWLEIVRKGREQAIRQLTPVVNEAGKRVIIKPAFVEKNGKLSAVYRFFPVDLEAAFGYGLLLVLDEDRDYRICRCKLPECQDFFLETQRETGAPRRVFCSPDCHRVFRRATGAERMRRVRSTQRQGLSKPRRLQK